MKTKTQRNTRSVTRAATPKRTLGAFNPVLPVDGALVMADVLRDQFNALNDDTQTRATQAAVAADVAALNAELALRPTAGQVDGQIQQAISATARNPAGVSPLYIAISDPPTQGEVQAVLERLNELIIATYRAP